MRKFLKILLLFVVVITVLCAGAWYYVTSRVTNKLNENYAGKDIVVFKTGYTPYVKLNEKHPDLGKKQNYIIRYASATAYGAPYKIAWNLNKFTEETGSFLMEYQSPVKFGYDLLRQTLFIHYDGIVNAYFKPKKNGFGSKLVIENYNIETFMPLSVSLINELTKSSDAGILLNYIDNISLINHNVSIFDLVGGEKFYEKEYEKALIKFKAKKNYTDINDFLNNIPQSYKITYDIKTKPNDAATRIVPASLFYGIMLVPSGNKLAIKVDIETSGSNYNEFNKGLTIDTQVKSDSNYLEVHNFDSKFKVSNDTSAPNYHWKENLNFTVKKGFFDAFIKFYQGLSESYPIAATAPEFHEQMLHLIRNKDNLHLSELENNKYQLILDSDWKVEGKLLKQKLNDFSLSSDYSGVKLKHEFTYSFNNQRWLLKGNGFINNYPPVIEYFSSYYYNISKYRSLGTKAHDLYIKANQDFAKMISDHPDSKSNDLSFEYDINSANYPSSKIGTVKILDIVPLYTLTVYQKLLDQVGYGGDVLSKMKSIIPSIDPKEPILKDILSKASLTNLFQKKPSNKVEDKDAGSDENIGQELFNEFMK